jgi:hypothetical protein
MEGWLGQQSTPYQQINAMVGSFDAGMGVSQKSDSASGVEEFFHSGIS